MLSWFFIFAPYALAGPPEETIERALRMGLQNSPTWHALMHFRPGVITGSPKSMVDDGDFFLSPAGKTDPGAELMADLKAFLTSPYTEDGSHPSCRFPARYGWAMAELGIEQERPPCPALDEFMDTLSPRGAALVFPEAHINSPASMFGHTLLRIDSSNESGLLSHAVSYAAHMPEGLEPSFVLKGLFGGYKGKLSINPYYEKINEYTHMESRDIWEYPLSLSPSEVHRMALHVWELRNMDIDYYFINDNCAYILLFIIEAARPEAVLTGQFIYPVTPVDTVRATINSGLVNSTHYRPSKATRIKYMESITPRSGLAQALNVADGTLMAGKVSGDETIDEATRVKTLELAAEYLQLMSMDAEAIGESTYQERYLSVLKARSTLRKLDYDIKAPPPPQSGHETARVTLRYGRLDDKSFASLTWRPAYHSLIDIDKGYRPGAAIVFLETEIRHYADDDKTVIERLMLLDITSLSPRGNFIRPLSWKMRVGVRREHPPKGPRTPFVLEAGFGLTGEFSTGLAWIMFDQSLKAGGALKDGHALGAGISAGLMLRAGDVYKMVVEGQGLSYGTGDSHREASGQISQSLRLGKDSSLNLLYKRGKLAGLYHSETMLGWNHYF